MIFQCAYTIFLHMYFLNKEYNLDLLVTHLTFDSAKLDQGDKSVLIMLTKKALLLS